MKKAYFRIPLPGQANHSPGYVDTFGPEAFTLQEVNESPRAAATNVQRPAPVCAESDRTFVGFDAI